MPAKNIGYILRHLALGGLVCALFFGALEGGVRLLPDQWFPKGALEVPLLAPSDRGSILLRKNGYRGKRPAAARADESVRIVTMGGSSTYGIPMYHSGKTFSAYLQRLLDARPGEHYEVLNGGIAGFGIWQVIEALENVIIADKPDIVILNVWFNDSSFIPGWYGYHGLSDHEAYEMVQRLRGIEGNFLYDLLRRSRVYALLRYAILSARTTSAPVNSKNRKRRSDLPEFELGVRRFLDLAAQHKFRPVFMLEPLNRTLPRGQELVRNRYYQILEKLAGESKVPVIDTLTPLADREGEWLFYDFIHPNEHGHEVLAEAIYAGLFSSGRLPLDSRP